ncbi:hypothetical protein [Nocardioides sp. SYSU DS0651]|uniref:hypothetical protein n=1 Tax=Nocardioides sp. SYSU DS0651 TaxID=3415955 RepID=UPI003F4B06C5
MSATADPHFDPDFGPDFDPEAVRAATQAAVDATATMYTTDAGLDVEQRLRIEMQDRGLDVDDDDWVAEVARRVRSGHDVRVGLPGQEEGDRR